MVLTWNSSKSDGMMIYNSKDDYLEYEIRGWPYDESGEGRFQLCVHEFHRGNFKTLKEAKEAASQGWY